MTDADHQRYLEILNLPPEQRTPVCLLGLADVPGLIRRHAEIMAERPVVFMALWQGGQTLWSSLQGRWGYKVWASETVEHCPLAEYPIDWPKGDPLSAIPVML